MHPRCLLRPAGCNREPIATELGHTQVKPQGARMMTRRTLLSRLAVGGFAAWFGPERTARAATSALVDPKKLTDEQWRSRLTAEQYRVLRREGTEAPFS